MKRLRQRSPFTLRKRFRRETTQERRLSFETCEPRTLLASTSYIVFDLGTLPDTDTSVAQDINNHGEVVGTSSHSGLVPRSRAFKWEPSASMQDLGTLGGTDAWAKAINDNGQIAGVSLDSDGKQDGFRYDPATDAMHNLGGLGSNAGVYPNGINSHGDVVGTSFHFGMQVAFLYTDADGMQVAGGTPSSSRTYLGYDVNDTGRIVGYSSPIGAFISGPGGVGAGALGTGWAYAINNADQVTGSTGAFDANSHLFRYTPGVGVADLGALPGGETVGLDINQAGQIVGKGKANDGTDHAIYWTESDGLQDLNDLISPDLGWELQVANGLNDSGSIVGTGSINGQQRAVLLTPFSGTDTNPPVAALEALPINTGNIDAFTFSVVYWDRSGVNLDSLDHTDLTVTAPDGTSHAASLVGVETVVEGISRLATYRVAAPNGTLGAQDNGTWRVSVNPDEVSDTLGETIAAGEIGTLDVAIDHAVTASISGPAIAQAELAESFTLEAGTTWSYDAGEAFQFAIDWDGDGVVDQTVNGPSGTIVEYAFDSAGDFTIRVHATDAHGASSLDATTGITVTGVAGYQVWQFGPAFSGAYRSGGGGLNWGGTLFVIGGSPYANGGEEAAVDSLAPGAATWQAEQHLDSGLLRDVGVGIIETGEPVFFGGTRDGQATSDAFIYSRSDGKGERIAAKLFAVTDFAFATDDGGRLYSLGGSEGTTQAVAFVERYDAGDDVWTNLAALPEPRAGAAATYDGAGHILVIGGRNASGQIQSTVFSYEIDSDTWSTIAPLPEPLTDGGAAVGEDRLVYFTGGQASGGESDRVYVFNPASGSWRTGPIMLAAHRDHAVAVSDDGFLYVMVALPRTWSRRSTRTRQASPRSRGTTASQPLRISV